MNELFYDQIFFLILTIATVVLTILLSIVLIRVIVFFKTIDAFVSFWKSTFKKIKK